MTARRILLCATTSVPLLGGCLLLGDHDGGREEPGPELVSISRDEIRVGQRLEFLAENIAAAGGGVGLWFEGEFRGDAGSIHRVNLDLQPEVVGDRLVIPYFGPYQVPFGDGDEIGLFTGTVTLVSGEEIATPLDVALRILPSIIVRELASADLSCERPARLLLAGGRLHLVAEAIGMDATEIAVRLGDGGEVSSADGVLELDIPALADDTLFAISELALGARGTGGDFIDSDYLIGIHRSLDWVDSAAPSVAQIEEPTPVSGCNSGGDTQGRTLAYSEQETDERARTVAFTWNESWAEENGELDDPAAFAERGLRGIVDGPRVGPDTDTFTVGGYEQRSRPTFRPGEDSFWEVASIDVLGGEEGMILPGEFGVWYRQTTRVAYPAAVVALDACGAPQVVAEAMAFDYRWDVELAQNDECPPFPEPSLPAAECFIAPCL
jgi:hypothetical protein